MEKLSLRTFGILGIVLFLPLFLFTFADPQLVEKSGKSFVEWKLQAETNKKIDSIALPEQTKLETLLGAKAEALRERTERRIEDIKRQLKVDTPAILAEQIAKLANLDCECRKKWEEKLRLSLTTELISLESAKAKLIDFSHGKYMEIVEKLTLDVRIFLGTNTVVFLFLLLVSFMKPVAIKHLFLPGASYYFLRRSVHFSIFLSKTGFIRLFTTITLGLHTLAIWSSFLLFFVTLCSTDAESRQKF